MKYIEATDPAVIDAFQLRESEQLRPYGPNMENICYTCAIKETTKRKFAEVVLGGYGTKELKCYVLAPLE